MQSIARSIAVAVAVVAALGVAAVAVDRAGLDDKPIEEVAELRVELADPMSRTKLAVWPVAFDTLRLYPWGAGAGGFGVASAKVIEPGSLAEARYRHVENIVLDTLASHGVVAGGIAILLSLAAAFVLARSARRASSRVLLAVVFGLFIGDLVDFSLELPAPFLLAMAVLGLAAARVRHESPDADRASRALRVLRALRAFRAGRSFSDRRALVVAPIALAAVCAVCAAAALASARDALTSAIADQPLAKRRPLVERAVRLHPLDGHYAYQLAVDARVARDPQRALVALNHVFAVWPGHSRAHLEAARALFALGRVEQAMVEYRVAYRIRRTPDVLEEVARRATSARMLRTAVPDEAVAVHQLAGKLRERCGVNARALVVEMPTLRDASQDHLAAALEWLQQCNDPKAATRVLTSWFRPLEGSFAARAARFLAERDPAQALAMSARWLNGSRDKAELLEWRARFALAQGDRARAEADAQALATASPDVAVRQRAALLQASLREEAGDLHGALALLQESTRSALPDPDALAARARIAHALGRTDDAARALEALRRRAPDHPALTKTPGNAP